MSEITYGKRDVLKDRRVRYTDGSEGVIERVDYVFGGENRGPVVMVRWPGERRASWKARHPATAFTLIDAPALAAPVRTRRVIYKGTKEQVAERLLLMGEAKASVERYVEFSPSAMAKKRWRIVEVGRAWTPLEIETTPNESPRAEFTRQAVDFRDY